MQRKINGARLLLATHNAGKVHEFRFLLGPLAIDLVTAGSLSLPVPEETGVTFSENARLKALAAAKASGEVALADDSGLCVDALNGAPGVYTADWAGPSRDFDHAMRLVEDALMRINASRPEQRTAHFVSLLCLAWPDGHTQEYLGRCSGTLIWPPRRVSETSHGYDPVFVPKGESRTFGEMREEEKHGSLFAPPGPRSHRARSLSLLAHDVLPDSMQALLWKARDE